MSAANLWFTNLIKKWEGGAAERPLNEDSQGLTNHGVTIPYWTSTAYKIVGKPPTREGLLSLTWDEAEKISKVGFWDKYKIDSIRNPALRIPVVEAAWGSGFTAGLKSMGYDSIASLNRDVFATPKKLYNKRLAWLQRLKNWTYNKNGWTNRLNDGLKIANKIQRKRLMLIGGATVVLTGFAYGGYRYYKSKR
jgi:lysozyme family protein